MKIIIKAETDVNTEEITITDDDLDNDNYISLIINNKEYIVNLNEINKALTAFKKV